MIVEQPWSPLEWRAAWRKGWASEPGRFGVRGHWFSSDLGQGTSHITAWPIIDSLLYRLP